MILFLLLASSVTVNVEQDVDRSNGNLEFRVPPSGGYIYPQRYRPPPGYDEYPSPLLLRAKRRNYDEFGQFNPAFPPNLRRTERIYEPDVEPPSRLQEER